MPCVPGGFARNLLLIPDRPAGSAQRCRDGDNAAKKVLLIPVSSKYVIIGAGPSGLALAHGLLQNGETSFVVIEKEQNAGGLCRSADVDGAPLDIGGGHFLEAGNARAVAFLYRFMGEEEWSHFDRISRIRGTDFEIDFPFEAHIYQLPIEQQVAYLESIAATGANTGTAMPDNFEAWIIWKLGDLIAKTYMLPYNRKIWSMPLEELGTYWLAKLPNVSFSETLRSCLERRPFGDIPAHKTFLYPKATGYGEVWQRMAAELGPKIRYGEPFSEIDLETKTINNTYRAETIISTIPWQAWSDATDLPPPVQSAIGKLEYSSIVVSYQREDEETDAHWIYLPDEATAPHRILCRNNFVANARGIWTETNSKRHVESSTWSHENEFAYPLNTRGKPDAIAEILAWARGQQIFGLGRWGEWEHMNSDVAVVRALELANKLTK